MSTTQVVSATPAANFVDIGGKFATGVNDTGSKFAAGVNNTDGNQQEQYETADTLK
jgi:hypothetical protein